MKIRVLVCGSNDIASAVAHAILQAGFSVAMHDIPNPAGTRRKMAFTDAILHGSTVLEGVSASRIDRVALLRGLMVDQQMIPLSIGDFGEILRVIRPHILIDARMRKHQKPEKQIELAPLTIGLGPNFVTGITTHLAVETAYGTSLGKVIRDGCTQALRGEPQKIGGYARERYVYAPCEGLFQTIFNPGDAVKKGQNIAQINEVALEAPLSGVLRGITHNNVFVSSYTKVIEVDVRGDKAQFSGIAERPRKIAMGVLNAASDWKKTSC